MAKTQLREDVTLARPNASGVLLGERVREAGLDPSVFCAVIPGECGTAGLVNGNGRIYQIAEAVSEHERLCRDATISPSFGERDHPDSGPSWNVITRFTGGRTEIKHRRGTADQLIFAGQFLEFVGGARPIAVLVALLDEGIGVLALQPATAGTAACHARYN